MRRIAWVLAAVALLCACGEGTPDSSSGEEAASSPSPGAERRTGTFVLSSGEEVSYWCAGEGDPGVLLEAGTDSGGTYASRPPSSIPWSHAPRSAPTTDRAPAPVIRLLGVGAR